MANPTPVSYSSPVGKVAAGRHSSDLVLDYDIDAGNVNSQAVARRLGSTLLRQDRLPAPFDDMIDIWGQTRDQWRARR